MTQTMNIACVCGRSVPSHVAAMCQTTGRKTLRCTACGNKINMLGQNTVVGGVVSHVPSPVVSPVETHVPVPASAGMATVLTDIARDMAESETPVLGYFTSWDIEGVELPLVDLETRAANAGIPADLIQRPETCGALRRAFDHLGISEDKQPGETRIVKFSYPGGEVIATIRDERITRDANGTLQAPSDVVQIVRYDNATKTLEFSTDYQKDAILDAWKHAQGTVGTQGISTLIRRALARGHALRMKRRGGGWYFVGEKYSDIVDSIRTLLDGIQTSRNGAAGSVAEVIALPLANVAAAKKDVLNAATREIQERAAALRQGLADFREAVAHGDPVRASTVRDRVAEYSDLREMILSYSESVGYATVGIMGDVASLETEASDLADKIEAEKAAKKKARVSAGNSRA